MASKIFYLLLSLVAFTGFSQSTDVVMNGTTNNTTVSTCLGGLYDSGGTGAGAGYGNNENFTITVCPNVPGDYMTLQWTIFTLDNTNTHPNAPNQTNADNITIYDGNSTAAPTLGTYYAGDLTPGDLFGATPANPTGCLTIQFVSNGSNNPGQWDYAAQLSCATPCDPPFADGIIINADNAAGDSIAVCVNEPVTFQDNGSTAGPSGLFTLEKWVWNWNDGTPNDTLLSGAQISHSFANPGQYVVQLVVIDDNDCVNTNATDIQVFVSTYPTFIPFPTDTTLCIGESIELAAAPDQYDSTWSGFPAQTYDATNCMEDLTGIVQPTPLPLTGFDPNISLDNTNSTDITSICIEIEHSFIGDFVLQVQCPTGQIMTLHQQGGGGVNLGDPEQGIIDCNDQSTFGVPWTYCFDNTATQTWVQAINAGGNTVTNSSGSQSLMAGNYAPVDPLGFAALDGCPINGTWNLLFTDLWGADDGSLPGWSINFDSSLYPPVTTFTPNIGNNNTGNPLTDSSYWSLTDSFIVWNSSDLDTILVTPTQAGTYTYTYYAVNNFGCEFDSSVTITVDPLLPIDAGPDVTLCIGQSILIGPDSTTGATCTYDVVFVDDWGDGWEGNEAEITTMAGGTVNYTGPTTDSLWVSLPVTHGETITIDFNNLGTNPGQCQILIYDATGALVYSDGIIGAPTNTPQNLVVNCFNGYTFEWTPTANILSSPNSQNPQVNPPVETVYTLTTYPLGHPLCSTTDSLTVFMGPIIDPGIDTVAHICIDAGPVDLFNYIAGTPQTNGYWLTPAGNPLAMPIDPSTFVSGVYQYRIDSLSCTESSFLTVTIVDLPITLVTTDATCTTVADGIISVSSAMATGYSIDGGATFQPIGNFTGLLHGSYNVVLTSAPNGNCTASTVAVIDEPDSLRITSLTPSQSVCLGSSILLNATASGGNGNYTFTWDHGLGIGPSANYSPNASDSVCVVLSEDCPSPTVSKCTYIEVPAPVDIDFSFAGEPIPKETRGCYDHLFQIDHLSSSTDIVVGGVVTSPATDVDRISTTWRIIDTDDGTIHSVLSSSRLDSVVHTLKTPGVYNS